MSNTSSSRRRSLHPLRALGLLTIVLGISVVGGCDSGAASAASVTGYRGIVLEKPIPRPDFTLTDTNGREFDFRRETEGRLTFVFVGYTHCPDICPIHMANLAAVLRQMPGVQARTRVIFITADPERDTPERMREWLNAFDHRFVGLRGTPEEIHAIEDALNIPRSIVPDNGEGNYAVGHAGQVIAFSPDGPARIVYPFGTRQTDFAADIPRLLSENWETK